MTHGEQAEQHASEQALATKLLVTSLEARLTTLEIQMNTNGRLLQDSTTTLDTITNTLSLQWLRDLGDGIKVLLQQVYVICTATHQAIVSIQARLPSQAERSMVLGHQPIYFEDARGRMSRIHLDFVKTWDMFDNVLELHFAGIPGFKKVKSKCYVLRDRNTRQDISRDREFDLTFLPGQQVEMGLLFERIWSRTSKSAASDESTCPRCQKLCVLQHSGNDYACAKCRMEFRFVPDTVRNFRNRLLLWQDTHTEISPNLDDDLSQFQRIQFQVHVAKPRSSAEKFHGLYGDVAPSKILWYDDQDDERLQGSAATKVNHIRTGRVSKVTGSWILPCREAKARQYELFPQDNLITTRRRRESLPPDAGRG